MNNRGLRIRPAVCLALLATAVGGAAASFRQTPLFTEPVLVKGSPANHSSLLRPMPPNRARPSFGRSPQEENSGWMKWLTTRSTGFLWFRTMVIHRRSSPLSQLLMGRVGPLRLSDGTGWHGTIGVGPPDRVVLPECSRAQESYR